MQGTTTIFPIVIPVSAEPFDVVSIEGAFPLTAAKWDQLMHVLEVMKPGLVVSGWCQGGEPRED
jgi:hypothetical protein